MTELKVSPRPVKLRPTKLPGTVKEPELEGVNVNVSVKKPGLWGRNDRIHQEKRAGIGDIVRAYLGSNNCYDSHHDCDYEMFHCSPPTPRLINL